MQELAPKAWQYGVLGVVALAFAVAIVHLWRTLREDAKQRLEDAAARETERLAWVEERAEIRGELERKEADLRAEYERKHRELVDHYTQLVRNEHRENREHEDRVRSEFAEIMERVSAEANKSSDALVNMLQKFYERFVGPSRGRY